MIIPKIQPNTPMIDDTSQKNKAMSPTIRANAIIAYIIPTQYHIS